MEEARLMLQNILHQVPSHLSARVLLARILESEGDQASALTMWKQAAFHGPGNAVIEAGLRDAILGKQFGETILESPVGEVSSPEEDPADVPQFQDLDKLIEELETAAIVPNPDIPLVSDEDLEQDLEDVVSETLARIYANQSYFEEAAGVYEKLADQQPERADEFRKKADEMKGRIS